MLPKIPLRWRTSFENYCFLVKPKQKADLIDGVIHMAFWRKQLPDCHIILEHMPKSAKIAIAQ
jgi:hypothetical protein